MARAIDHRALTQLGSDHHLIRRRSEREDFPGASFSMEQAIQSLLRSTEQVRLILQTTLVRERNTSEADDVVELPMPGPSDEPRLIAIISHKDNWSGEDEGCVFVFKQHNSSDNNGLDLEKVYPIDETFTLSIAQSHRAPGDTARMSIHEAAATGFMFSLSSHYMEEMLSPRPIVYFTNDIVSLRNFSRACNEIRNTYETKQAAQVSVGITVKFQWLEPYILQSEMFSAFNTHPQDLRTLNQPLHTQLKPAIAGLPGDDLVDLALIRDDWIRNTSRSQSIKAQRSLKIRLGTFNVNDQVPTQDLSSWVQGKVPNEYGKTIPPVEKLSPLPLDKILSADAEPSEKGTAELSTSMSKMAVTPEDDKDDSPDLIVLGFQELDLSTEALIYATSTLKEDAWCSAAVASLGEKGADYRKLASRQLVGTLLVVLVKASVAPSFSDVRTAAAGIGVLGMMGNKGGIAIGFNYTPPPSDEVPSPGPTTFTFVNTHLAAFDEQYEKRNYDYKELARRLVLAHQTIGTQTRHRSVFESDYLFWMGDLNYRLEVPDEDIRAILGANYLAGRLEVLQKYDQLKLAQRQNKAFEGFQEPPITFLPTYRFSPGVVRDDLDYDVKRKPAWTDRVLYMTSPIGRVQSTSYLGHPRIKISDHKPVSADYLIGVDLFDDDFRKETAKGLYKSLHALDDPSVKRGTKLGSTTVEFGDIHYEREEKRTITVTNSSKVPCAYRFVASEEGSSITPDWLKVEPIHALLLPEEEMQITFTVLVDNTSAQRINLTEKNLQATLILHTLLSKDHFISVTGTYQYTCFANKLSTLIRLPEAIRNVESVNELLPENAQINAPKEIMRLVNWLMSEQLDVEGLFVTPGADETVHTIRECLDTGEEFPFKSGRPNPALHLAFATTLLKFLDSMSEALVPSKLHLQCAQMKSRDEAFELLDVFPVASVNVWISVTAYLHYICQSPPTPEKKIEKAKQLALVFAPVLLRDDPDVIPPPISILAKIGFLLFFMT